MNWISTKKAAEIIGVSQRTIQNWADSNKLLATRTSGGHRRIHKQSVHDLLQGQQPAYQIEAIKSLDITPISNGSLLKVLIIESDLKLIEQYELRFSQFLVPHKLFIAHDPIHAIYMTGRHQPHVIFTDLAMEEINGIQLIQELSSIPELHGLRIVILTALNSQDIEAMGKLPDSIMILPKPAPFSAVESLLHQENHNLNSAFYTKNNIYNFF